MTHTESDAQTDIHAGAERREGGHANDDATTTVRSGSRLWVVFVVAAVLFAAMGSLWAIATPLFAVPDEPDHAVRAVATWSGDPTGTEVVVDGVPLVRYRVPTPYQVADQIAACNAFQPDLAPCGPAFVATGRKVTELSTAGLYPPLFYRLTGWAGALWPGGRGMYMMRLIQVAACAVLIGVAAIGCVRLRRGTLPLLGVAFAVTPMVLFLSGSVNSSGLEAAAAIALWASLLSLLRNDDRLGADAADLGASGRSTRWLPERWPDAIAALGSGTVLIATRTFSPGFAAVICAIALLSAPEITPRVLLRRRDLLATFGGLAIAAVAAALLVVRSGQFDHPAIGGRPLLGIETPLSIGLGYQELGFRQMIAVFGWLDTGTAQLSYYAWILGGGALMIGALVLGRWRRIAGVALALLATVALPIASNWGQAETSGFVWQGRYGLPIAAGIPILAALAVAESGLPSRISKRATVTFTAIVAIGQIYALYWSLRRFSVGVRGDLIFFGDSAWSPPFLGGWGTAILAVAVTVAFVVALTTAAIPDDDHIRGRRVAHPHRQDDQNRPEVAPQ